MSDQGQGSRISLISTRHMAKVAPMMSNPKPAAQKATTAPTKKQISFLETRLKKTFLEVSEEDLGPNSIGSKVFLVVVALGAFSLGIGCAYYGSTSQIRDFIILGVGCLVVGVIVLIGLAMAILRRALSKPSSSKAVVVREPVEALPQYFIPPNDLSATTLACQHRRPSTSQLYSRRTSRTKEQSLDVKSDGVLTVSGVVMEREDSREDVFTPPPQLTCPRSVHDINNLPEVVEGSAANQQQPSWSVFKAPIKMRSDLTSPQQGELRADPAALLHQMAGTYDESCQNSRPGSGRTPEPTKDSEQEVVQTSKM